MSKFRGKKNGKTVLDAVLVGSVSGEEFVQI